MIRDTRAVSTGVDHVLTLAIAAILISGLLVASDGLFTDQRENAAERELTVIGEHLALEIGQVDRLNDEGDDAGAILRTEHSYSAAGSSYTVELDDSDDDDPGDTKLTLNSSETSASVDVYLRTNSEITPNEISGGDILIELQDGKIMIKEAN